MLAYLELSQLGETTDLWLALLQLATSLGGLTALVAMARLAWNKYRWSLFKLSVVEWLRDRAPAETEHPKLLDEGAWIAMVEGLLTKSRFSPFEAEQLIELAVPVARQIVRSQLI